jgi:hypothetical protein
MLLLFASTYWLVRGRLLDMSVEEAILGASFGIVEALFPGVDRLIAAIIRLAGTLGIVASVALMAVSATGFRRGERWAWYVMWALVLFPTLDLAVLAGYGALTGAAALWDGSMILLALAGLLLPQRAARTVSPA